MEAPRFAGVARVDVWLDPTDETIHPYAHHRARRVSVSPIDGTVPL